MPIAELSNEQRRQLIDAQQVFAAWRPLAGELADLGGLYWNTSKGSRYLYSKRDGVRTSLGRETPELVRRKTEHDVRARRLRGLVRPLAARMDKMAPVNRALRLGRMPATPARVIRRLDQEGVLGVHFVVAGTNAMFAYEAAAGVVLGGEYVATGDADLLWDSRKFLELAGSHIQRAGLLATLRDIDSSFEAHYGYNAFNKDGYIVDLISPDEANLPTRLGKGPDLESKPMTGASWLLDSPRFEQVIVGGDGLPLRIVAPDPRTYALHKLWLSRRQDRQQVKRPRDLSQAKIVAEIARTYFGVAFRKAEMPWLPKTLADLCGEFR